ncbi:hypothetical protein [Jiangella anatolica]|uniref:hypothetical protein n=1 Tax=Jiangella anatolica TaxID=2670374 RepID=UPI0011B4B644|nr:hypothetical protein [Jiangella anatolica]
MTAGDDPGTALSLLRTAVRTGVAGVLTPRPAATTAEAADRLAAEIGWTYPAFALRGLDWPAISARHREPADLADLQRWVAELRGPHTSVRAAGPRRVLPYTALAGADGVRLAHVPRWSAGWAAGAVPAISWSTSVAHRSTRRGCWPRPAPRRGPWRGSPAAGRSPCPARPLPTSPSGAGVAGTWPGSTASRRRR